MSNNDAVTIIIPARYDSTRFPGKPLALINNKPMILHVCDGCAPAFGKDKVIVTTDDDRISYVVASAGYKVIMTRKDQVFHTGMDRVSYASKFVDSDYIINVQGDEPLVCAEDIINVYNIGNISLNDCIVNCYKVCENKRGWAEINSNTVSLLNNVEDPNAIKVIIADNYVIKELIYMSRQPIPTNCKEYKKQVCIYGMPKVILHEFYGEGKEKSILEKGEDIEILRVLDVHSVDMISISNTYQSVDIESDIKKVERILNERML